MISTRDLSLLPDIAGLRRALQSMAMLDAILASAPEFRYYGFFSNWSPGEQMASMQNGSGDEFYAHFSSAGCWVKGFDHESPMSPYHSDPPRPWPGVLDAVPPDFAACLREPAFNIADVTFCIWRRPTDAAWQVGPVRFPADWPDPDGSERLLLPLDGRPGTYHQWASFYYERDVDLHAIEQIYLHEPLTAELVTRLNPTRSMSDLEADVREIGYPPFGRAGQTSN